jgi:UDP-N-acetyl-D-glucosamine dehydrogenase
MMADDKFKLRNMTLDNTAPEFIRMAETRELHVGILGMGYVGLPLAQAFLRQGFRVTGFDIDQRKIEALTAGDSYIKHIRSESVAAMNETGRFAATENLDELSKPDAILICVPTPLDDHRDPDLGYVIQSTEEIGRRLRRGQLVVLESTTWPGTSEEVMLPILERASGLKAGLDFAIAYSPEREDPGNPKFETSSVAKVVGANSDLEREMALALYSAIVPRAVDVSDLATAEAVKLTENIFRAVNIGLVNELKIVFDRMGIDVWEVIQAADTKPFGFMAFFPGPGLGGHCIPIDPFYLTWKARSYGVSTRFIELAGEINAAMPAYAISRLSEALNDKFGKPLSGSRILIVGLAYKKNVDDMRESPAITLIEILQARGALVHYYDPYIPVAPHLREHPAVSGMESVRWEKPSLTEFDAALISTDHDEVNYRLLCESIPLIVDTRNATADLQKEFASKIIKA